MNVPNGVALDDLGNVYVADTYSSKVLKVDRANPPSLEFLPTKEGSTSEDSPQEAYVANIGNASLAVSAVAYPRDFSAGPTDEVACSTGVSVAPGSTCSLAIQFTPVTPLDSHSSKVLKEAVDLTTNAVNTATAKQQIAVSGTELPK